MRRPDCFRPSDRLAGWDSHPREIADLHGVLSHWNAVRRTKRLITSRITRKDAGQLVCCWASGIEIRIGHRNLGTTGSTNSLENGGTLEKTQSIVAYSTASTTKLYDPGMARCRSMKSNQLRYEHWDDL